MDRSTAQVGPNGITPVTKIQNIQIMQFLDIRGIKHDFPFINICKVPREVLKIEGEARGFQPP